MIQNERIELVNIEKRYNPETSAVEEQKHVLSTMYGNVTEMSAERTIELFGEYIKGVKVIRLAAPVFEEFTQVIIDDKTYYVNSILRSRDRTTIVVKEMKSNA